MPDTASIKLVRFKAAVGCIYGTLSPSSNDLATWTPPLLTEGCGRYLWTDAFGVLNFLTLSKETGELGYIEYAKRLIQAVHDTLGRTRDGTERLPGATDESPLSGGLRIGKAEESGDDGDGQYHHYLTLWMFALNRFSLAAGEPRYNELAVELAKAVHPHFVYNRDTSRPRMYWKISMDMQEPLVRSEGNLDPIDGYVVFSLLQRTMDMHSSSRTFVLAEEIGDYKKIVETKWRHYSSNDTLDLGMTLWTAHWLDGEEEWATVLAKRAFNCLDDLVNVDKFFDLPVQYRLAFRDFGTAMGVQCYNHDGKETKWTELANQIVDAWDQNGRLMESTGRELQPITMVMFAAALVPGAFRKCYF